MTIVCPGRTGRITGDPNDRAKGCKVSDDSVRELCDMLLGLGAVRQISCVTEKHRSYLFSGIAQHPTEKCSRDHPAASRVKDTNGTVGGHLRIVNLPDAER